MNKLPRPLITFLFYAVAPAADFSGSVLSSDNKPVDAEILITGLGHHRSFQTPSGKTISRPVPGAGPRRASVRLRADGTFNLRALTEGEYLVCVKAAIPYLNPCDWGPPAGFRVENGRVSGGVDLRLQAGAVIDIRVEDPSRSLANAPDTVRGSAISVGIMTSDGRYVPAALAVADAQERTYSVAVPAGLTPKLSFSSRIVRLLEGSRAPASHMEHWTCPLRVPARGTWFG